MPGVKGISSPTPIDAGVDDKGNKKTYYTPNDYIYFGKNNGSDPIKWRVLGLNGNDGSYSDGEKEVTGDKAMFLLSEYVLATGIQFFGGGTWVGSNAQNWCKDFAGEEVPQMNVEDAFTTNELAAILATSKAEDFDGDKTNLFGMDWKESELSGDKVFFLSADELASTVGNYNKAPGLQATFNSTERTWWLRSPSGAPGFTTGYVGIVDGSGDVGYSYVYSFWASRPAFNLNLNAVLFTSKAVDGKPTTLGISDIPSYDGNEWKLTIKGRDREGFTVTSAVKTATGYSVTYSGATANNNEWISAMIIADATGAYTHYGRIAQPTATTGTVNIDLSGIDMTGKTLYVFNEQCNGNQRTDFASPLRKVEVYTVTVAAGNTMTKTTNSGALEQTVLANGNTAINPVVFEANSGYYFPENYGASLGSNGVSVTRNSATQITVSGTPTGNVSINLPDATAITLESIVITTQPTKTSYVEGEAFDPAGMVVTATYSDGSSRAVTGYNISNGANLGSGQTSVSISYTEAGTTKTTFQPITVRAKVDAATPAISAHPASASYVQGDTATALTVNASVNDGGQLSYQWYQNENNSNEGGIPIGGANQNSYTPSTETIGTTYYYCVVTNTNENATGSKTATATSNVAAVTVNAKVTITAGANMTKTTGSGDLEQTVGANTAITSVVFTANENYYFPEGYGASLGSNGVRVTRDSETQITVSGTPTANASITLSAATAAAAAATPEATFTATGYNTGTLTGVESTMQISFNSGVSWKNVGFEGSTGLTDVNPGEIWLKRPGNGSTTVESAVQKITVTRATTPALEATQPTTIGGTGSIPTTTEHEYSADGGTSWVACEGTLTVAVGNYKVRVKAKDTALASEPQAITISEPVSYTVTLNIRLDGAAYPTALTVALDTKADATEPAHTLAQSGDGYTATLLAGTYYIYVDGKNTGRQLTPETGDLWYMDYYTVTFDADGGEPAPENQIVLSGNVATEPTGVTKQGYTLEGWYDGVTKWNFATPVTAKRTLAAKWVEESAEDEDTAPACGLTITQDPQDQTVEVGKHATFTVEAFGSGLTYQWYIYRDDGLGWQKIDGATSDVYITSETTLQNDGYLYFCEVTDAHGHSIQSDSAALYVVKMLIPPKTGDDSMPLLCFVAAILAGAGLIILHKKAKRA